MDIKTQYKESKFLSFPLNLQTKITPNFYYYKLLIGNDYVKNKNYEKVCNKANDKFHNYIP